MLPESLLSGENAVFLDQQYQVWLKNPEQVDVHWQKLFSQLDEPAEGQGEAPVGMHPYRKMVDRLGARPTEAAGDSLEGKVVQLINAYRVRGHMEADIDPLGRRERVQHPELNLTFYGLSESDLSKSVSTVPMFGMAPRATLGEIIARLKLSYCDTIGAEFMNIQDLEQKFWVQEQLETFPLRHVLTRKEELRMLQQLSDAENFERTLHTRFPGTKRFSLEGAETLIPMLGLITEHAGIHGIKELVLGMAHRGRLNTLVNVLEKPVHRVIQEFQDVEGHTQGSGDVKYHRGYSADVETTRGRKIHISLTPNPSHLEAVNPVVEGRVRAKQDRFGDENGDLCMAVLLHGDAAFAGQGMVAEVLNLSELKGYRTGGTIHVIVNNQIGFTTPPSESRSTPYATDIARMLAIPIFHVNGEDPRAVAAVVEMAVSWRMQFRRDVIIDMYCYRKHGHNEGDEPSFTQPLLYKLIGSRPTPRAVCAARLVQLGDINHEDVARIHQESQERMAQASAMVDSDKSSAESTDSDGSPSEFRTLWDTYRDGQLDEKVDTSVSLETLQSLLRQANSLPEDFTPHPKIERLLRQRLEMAEGIRMVDWAVGEQAAMATLLAAGHPVRLSGQDTGRGTFSHRHAVVADLRTGKDYFSLSHLDEKQGRFDAIDSSLSEAGVLGFETGYAFDTPDGLVVWEAQFGDFANGAQVIIDQFLTASEQKWGRLCGVVLLLPHGYAGQGPEHSSARLERFLLMCAQNNIQVANVTTPAQYFHLLRRQVLRTARRPLIIMTPKGLLRHRKATSSLEELSCGPFSEVLDDGSVTDAEAVERVVFCSGKIYYEIQAEGEKQQASSVAVVRVEQLYPYPEAEIERVLARYPEGAEILWCQEEPRNMGAWPVFSHWMRRHLPPTRTLGYIGREAAAAPATGSYHTHVTEQQEVVEAVFALQPQTLQGKHP